jgi:hypothetical protein
MNISQQISESVSSLQAALLSTHPDISSILRTIHTTLKANPDCVTLLSEDEIGIIISGLKQQTNTEIATSISKGGKGKGVKSIGISDL